jgi:PEP-CTERM motif
MQFKALAAAALLAVAGSQALAAYNVEGYEASTSTYVFGTFDIGANGSFSFTANLADGLASGVYDIVGDISSTNFDLTSVTLNGHDWTLYTDSKGKYRFGDIDLTEATDLVIEVSGVKYGTGKGNFQGSLVLSAVPEPETYALMLAGLGAVGFMARRRKLS